MNIPNLPTDNLYKFIALTGLVLIVLSILYPETKHREIRDEITVHEGKIAILDLDLVKDKKGLDEVQKEIQEIKKEVNCDCIPFVNDSMIVRPKVLDGPTELLEQSQKIDLLIREWQSIREQLNIKTLELNTKAKLISDKSRDLAKMDYIIHFISPLLLGFTLLFFFIWYQRTQRYQDKLLKEQVEQYPTFKNCQSCGMKLSDQTECDISLQNDSNQKYCQTCFQDDSFTEPDLSLNEMNEKVKARCEELGFGRLTSWILSYRLQNLDRWRKKFNWKKE